MADDKAAVGNRDQDSVVHHDFCVHDTSELKLDPSIKLSSVPLACEDDAPCCLGIDEAGRGPVLGPMVFGVVYWPHKETEDIEKLGFNDSKALNDEIRGKYYEEIVRKQSHRIGSGVCVLSPEYISAQMLSRFPVSLNTLSHNSTIQLIKKVISQGVRVSEIYVDAVGSCESYQRKLERVFGNHAKITVKPKVDALYKVVGAASICAKVSRDRITASWKFHELRPHLHFEKLNCSGYPGDAATIKWLEKNHDFVFGFPSVARFSWSTIRKRAFNEEIEDGDEPGSKLEAIKTCKVQWENYESEAINGGSTINTFFSNSAKRPEFFKKRKLELVTSLF